ncbi:hypothetical protein KVR801_140056 [Klebsiella variicola]|nr:hypothetical protein KVR801_140056 [Klebsiella variicola]
MLRTINRLLESLCRIWPDNGSSNRANGYRATAPLKVKPEPGELLEVVGLDPQIAKPSADSFPEASSSAWALPAPWRQTRSLC